MCSDYILTENEMRVFAGVKSGLSEPFVLRTKPTAIKGAPADNSSCVGVLSPDGSVCAAVTGKSSDVHVCKPKYCCLSDCRLFRLVGLSAELVVSWSHSNWRWCIRVMLYVCQFLCLAVILVFYIFAGCSQQY